MPVTGRGFGILMMIIILIISIIYLGFSICIVQNSYRYGDIFGRERDLSIFNIVISGFGIIIALFGLIAIITGRPALNKVLAAGCTLLGLCAFISLIVALAINLFAIDYVSSHFLKNMNSYKDSSVARNIVNNIQTKYDCCGDNIWLDWSRISLDATMPTAGGLSTTQIPLWLTGDDESASNSSSSTQIPFGLDGDDESAGDSSSSTQIPFGLDGDDESTSDSSSSTQIPFWLIGDDTSTISSTDTDSDTLPSSDDQDVRRKRQSRLTYGNIYGLPLSYGITLPQSCCTNDAPTASNSLNSYCISNANNVPNNFHIYGCSKKITKYAIAQAFIMAIISSILLVFALVAIPIANKIYPVPAFPLNTYYRNSSQMEFTPHTNSEHGLADDKTKLSVVNPNVDYSIFQ